MAALEWRRADPLSADIEMRYIGRVCGDGAPWTADDLTALERAVARPEVDDSVRRVRARWQRWSASDDRALVIILEHLCQGPQPAAVVESWVKRHWLFSATHRARAARDHGLVLRLRELGAVLWPDEPRFRLDVHSQRPALNPPLEPRQAALRTRLATIAKVHGPGQAERELEGELQRGAVVDTPTYNVLLMAYAASPDLASFERLLADMQRAGHRPDHGTHVALMCAYCGAGRLDDAEIIRRQLTAQGSRSDPRTYSAFVHGYAKAGRLAEAERELASMRADALRPNAAMLATLMGAYAREQLFDEAEQVLHRALKHGETVDSSLYARLFSIQARAGRSDAAARTRARLEADVRSLSPRAYADLVLGAARLGDHGEVERLLSTAPSSTADPSLLQPVLLKAYVERKAWDRAWALLESMHAQHIKPPAKLALDVLHGLATTGGIEPARLLRAQLRADGIAMTPKSYESFIHGYAKLERLREAEDELLAMLANGTRVRTKGCTPLLGGYLRAGQIEAAERIVTRLEQTCGPPTQAAMAWGDGVRSREARLIARLNALGLIDDALCGTVVNACVKVGRLAEAEEIFTLLRSWGESPNPRILGALLRGYSSEQRFDDVGRLLSEPEVRGALDAEAFKAVLASALRAEQLERVAAVFVDMLVAGVRPATELCRRMLDELALRDLRAPLLRVVEALAQAELEQEGTRGPLLAHGYLKLGDYEAAWSALQGSGVNADSTTLLTFNAVIQGYARSGRPKGALRVLEHMRRCGPPPDHWTFSVLLNAVAGADWPASDARKSVCAFLDDGLRTATRASDRLVVYNSAIKALARSELTEEVASLEARMLEEDLKPDRFTTGAIAAMRERQQGLHHSPERRTVSGAAERWKVVRAMGGELVRELSRPAHAVSVALEEACRFLALGATGEALEALDSVARAKRELVERIEELKAFSGDDALPERFDVSAAIDAAVRRLDRPRGAASPWSRIASEPPIGARETAAAPAEQGVDADLALRWQEIRTIAGDLVHELSQPLSALVSDLGSAQRFLLRGAVVDGRLTLESAMGARQKLIERLEQYRSFSGLDSTPEVFDVRDAIVAVATRLRRETAAPNALRVGEHASEVFQAPLLARGPRVLLEHALRGLLTNALDEVIAHGVEQPLVVLSAVPDRQRRWIDIRVRDNGRGVPPEKRAHIFEFGYTTKKERGLGIGLSLANNVAVQFGGQLELTETNGAGAEFWLRIAALPSQQGR